MILISHRGNLLGVNPEKENNPEYCQEAIDENYNVEIDVRWLPKRMGNDTWWTGHDSPKYRVTEDFLKNSKVWCHAKDIITLGKLLDLGAHCFWHDRDKATLTSKGYIWTAPLEELTQSSICVLPERQRDIDISKAAGICSDFIAEIPYSSK